jgi:hypothetical protein
LTLALVPPLQAEGAALATFGAEAILAVSLLVALAVRHPTLRPSFAALWRLVVPLAAGAGVAVVLPAPSVVLAVMAGVVYLALAFAFRAVPPELVAAVFRREPPPGT